MMAGARNKNVVIMTSVGRPEPEIMAAMMTKSKPNAPSARGSRAADMSPNWLVGALGAPRDPAKKTESSLSKSGSPDVVSLGSSSSSSAAWEPASMAVWLPERRALAS